MNTQKFIYWGCVAPLLLAGVVLVGQHYLIEDYATRCKKEKGIMMKGLYNKPNCVKSQYTVFAPETTE